MWELTYKRGKNKKLNVYSKTVFGVYKVGYITKCEVLKEYFFYNTKNDIYKCSGLTLKECKQILNENFAHCMGY